MTIEQQIKEYLVKEGWENSRLPYQYHTDDYYIVENKRDSFDFPIYSIINKRYDERMFMGRILSLNQLIYLLCFIKEDYNLTESEKLKLDEIKKLTQCPPC
jgi:hypothetical protein